MKKIAILALLVVFSLAAVSVFADIYYTYGDSAREQGPKATNYKDNAVYKLTRGVINGATCWMEIPMGVAKVTNESNNIALGLTEGLVVGFADGIGRLAAGVADVGTFIIPPYEQSLIQPEYVFTPQANEKGEQVGLMAQLRKLDDKISEYLW